MEKVCILDYGSGNVQSVLRAFQRLETQVKVSNSEKDLIDCTHVVLPGVGAFPAAMKKIERLIGINKLKEQLESGKPFLGICVGMQVLATAGYEFSETKGVNHFESSKVEKLSTFMRLPHVGWNNIEHDESDQILRRVPNSADFYFVHSYAIKSLIEPSCEIAFTNYGSRFLSVIRKFNVYGVQFHPEKSQRFGELLLQNFLQVK